MPECVEGPVEGDLVSLESLGAHRVAAGGEPGGGLVLERDLDAPDVGAGVHRHPGGRDERPRFLQRVERAGRLSSPAVAIRARIHDTPPTHDAVPADDLANRILGSATHGPSSR